MNSHKLQLTLFLPWRRVFFSVTGCGPSSRQEAIDQKEVIPVRVIGVKLKDIQKTLDYVGDIRAEDEAVVYPKVSGKIVEKLKTKATPLPKAM